MPVDYGALREENIKRYGTDTDLFELLALLYADRSHFILELLQNADDARATTVRFELFSDRLEVRHDGRPFSAEDVRGICGVAKSTKRDDLTKIGKFGIGFKSIYAYTTRPDVHSGGEHFRIEDYVRPFARPPVSTIAGETLFVIPFDRAEAPKGAAVAEISETLNNLTIQSLLFLRAVKTIHLHGVDVESSTLSCEPVEFRGLKRTVALVARENGQRATRELWALWERPVNLSGHAGQRVEIAAHFTEGPDGALHFRPLDQSPLVVFFPTAKETSLGVLIQGPYRTTPARDNTPQDNAENRQLVAQTAELFVTVLRDLRDRGHLTVDFLAAVPLHPNLFPPGSMFRPIFEAVRDALRREPLLPAEGGGYVSAKEAKLGRSKTMRALLAPPTLSTLWPSGTRDRWLHEGITSDRTPALYRYAKDELHIEEITPESLLPRLTSTFLSQQSDQWLCDLYDLLLANQALWRAPRWDGDPHVGPARTLPIIRLDSGRHVAPFDGHGQEQVWLPGPVQSGFPTAKAALLHHKGARDFLVALGLTPPDLSDDVTRHVIPRYLGGDVPDDVTHQADIERIFRALDEVRGPDRRKLIDFLKKVPFLHTTDAAGQPRPGRLRASSALYEPTPHLKLFLAANPDAVFVHPMYNRYIVALRELGVATAVRIQRRPADGNGYVHTVREKRNHKRGLANFDPKASIEHLAFALDHPTIERSLFVWNELLEGSLIKGIVEHSTRVNFDNPSRQEAVSPVGQLAATRRWLPGPDGQWHRPDELTLKDLPATFRRKEDLAQALGMVMPEIEQASRQLGVDADLLMFVQQNPDQVRALLQKEARRAVSSDTVANDDEDDEDQGLDFREDLGRRFARQAPRPSGEPTVPPNGTVTNPELRRARVADEIATQRANEPPRNQRFRRVSTTVWEGRGSEVRAFLEAQYGGRCQICCDGFAKRNGNPYFEGLYLVPRRKAAWIDRPGNVLGLCATCTAKFEHGSVEADDILEQVGRWYPGVQDGKPTLTVLLCGETVQVHFTEKHLLDLQEMLTAALAPIASNRPETSPTDLAHQTTDFMAQLEASLAAARAGRNRPAGYTRNTGTPEAVVEGPPTDEPVVDATPIDEPDVVPEPAPTLLDPTRPRLVRCPTCGATNRLPDGCDVDALRCTLCGGKMSWSPTGGAAEWSDHAPIQIHAHTKHQPNGTGR